MSSCITVVYIHTYREGLRPCFCVSPIIEFAHEWCHLQRAGVDAADVARALDATAARFAAAADDAAALEQAAAGAESADGASDTALECAKASHASSVYSPRMDPHFPRHGRADWGPQ